MSELLGLPLEYCDNDFQILEETDCGVWNSRSDFPAGECWPAVPTIAREIRLSEKTVRRAILDLRKAKILETEQRYRTKGGNDLHLSTSHNGRLTIISIPLSICIIVSIAMLN